MGSGFNLEGPGSVLEAVGVLAAIISVHECGHFLAARLQGIRVTQFAVGFGPQLFTYKGPEVEYSLRAIPLGGYVAFPDDDPSSTIPKDDPDLLKNRPLGQRAVVISAGVIANVLFALTVLFAQVTTVGTAQSAYLPGVQVPQVNEGGPAQRAGFQAGDIIQRIGDYEIPAASSQVPDLVSRIKASPAQRVEFTITRGGTQLLLPVVPAAGRDGQGSIGVSLLSNTFIRHTKATGIGNAVELTLKEFNRLGGAVTSSLTQLFTNFSSTAGQLSGPIAIVAQGSQIARTDSAGLFQFCAIVNINLAAVNLLPLPALDGGYLLLLGLEAARGGRKLPAVLEQGVALSGLLMLTVLGVGLVIKDTLSLL